MMHRLSIPRIIHFKRNKELLVSLFILIPYLDFYSVIGWMEIYFKASYLRAVACYMLLLTVALELALIIRRRNFRNRREWRSAGINCIRLLLVYTIVINLFLAPDSTTFSVYFWFAIPAIFAMTLFKYCRYRKLDLNKIVVYSLQIFACYLVVLIIVNIITNRLFIDLSIRMDPRGGGAVIFGYTIAFLFSILINYRKYFTTKKYYLLMVLYSIGVVATQSRGAMWPVALLWGVSFLKRKYKPLELILLLTLFIVAVSVDWLAILEQYLPRFLNNRDESRTKNFGYLLLVFLNVNSVTRLFGTGYGKFFPYQKWIMSMMGTAEKKTNLFISQGYSLLVQPHNSFMYMLIEGGIIAVILLFACVVLLSLKKYKRESFSIINVMPFLLFILTNNLDSILFVEPGVAAVFWILLLMYSNDSIAAIGC